MQNRPCIVLCNLKPVAMRGIKSHAMVLCATSIDGATVELLEPPVGSKPGDRVVVQGYDKGAPDAVLNPKKKVWETLQPGLVVSDTLAAGWKGEDGIWKPLLVQGLNHPIQVASAAGGSIK